MGNPTSPRPAAAAAILRDHGDVAEPVLATLHERRNAQSYRLLGSAAAAPATTTATAAVAAYRGRQAGENLLEQQASEYFEVLLHALEACRDLVTTE